RPAPGLPRHPAQQLHVGRAQPRRRVRSRGRVPGSGTPFQAHPPRRRQAAPGGGGGPLGPHRAGVHGARGAARRGWADDMAVTPSVGQYAHYDLKHVATLGEIAQAFISVAAFDIPAAWPIAAFVYEHQCKPDDLVSAGLTWLSMTGTL